MSHLNLWFDTSFTWVLNAQTDIDLVFTEIDVTFAVIGVDDDWSESSIHANVDKLNVP